MSENRPPFPAEVLARARDGDPGARDALLRAHLPAMRAMARRLARRSPGSDPDDLVQEGMLAALGCLPRFEPAGGASLATYVSRVAWRAMRRSMRRGPPVEAGVDPDTLVRFDDAAGRARDLREALALLPEGERRAVELRHGLAGGPPVTLAEAAEAMGLPRRRAAELHRRGLESLRGRLS